MKLPDLIKTLEENPNQEIIFRLNDGRELGGDLHITEVKNAIIESVDCGSNAHQFKETIIQLWINEDSDIVAKWSAGKALRILKKTIRTDYKGSNSEVYFEFGDSITPVSKYSFTIAVNPDRIIFDMFVEATACKPRLNKELACC
ncbi:MAG: hypothetical protein ED557_14765 [Balneola sp.]|nr:MAG: hypothetical protein ED557_14765 [Balneola sp.]